MIENIYITHFAAQYFMKGTGIKKPTFFQRVILRDIKYIEPFGGERLYSVEDWNNKCSDYKLSLERK